MRVSVLRLVTMGIRDQGDAPKIRAGATPSFEHRFCLDGDFGGFGQRMPCLHSDCADAAKSMSMLYCKCDDCFFFFFLVFFFFFFFVVFFDCVSWSVEVCKCIQHVFKWVALSCHFLVGVLGCSL